MKRVLGQQAVSRVMQACRRLVVPEVYDLMGRVEDVFGPVMEPLYSLRYACGSQMPPEIAVGTELFCIQRLTEYILPQELYVKGWVKALRAIVSCCISQARVVIAAT